MGRITSISLPLPLSPSLSLSHSLSHSLFPSLSHFDRLCTGICERWTWWWSCAFELRHSSGEKNNQNCVSPILTIWNKTFVAKQNKWNVTEIDELFSCCCLCLWSFQTELNNHEEKFIAKAAQWSHSGDQQHQFEGRTKISLEGFFCCDRFKWVKMSSSSSPTSSWTKRRELI